MVRLPGGVVYNGPGVRADLFVHCRIIVSVHGSDSNALLPEQWLIVNNKRVEHMNAIVYGVV